MAIHGSNFTRNSANLFSFPSLLLFFSNVKGRVMKSKAVTLIEDERYACPYFLKTIIMLKKQRANTYHMSNMAAEFLLFRIRRLKVAQAFLYLQHSY